MNKKKLLLIAPSLKQGGFQRVCARTAVLLREYFDVSIVVFDGTEIAYPLEDISILDIGVRAQKGAVHKVLNVWKRIQKVRAIKKEHHIDIAYSFGMSANLINSLTCVGDTIWCGIRSYVDLHTKTIGLVCKHSDCVICCSKVLESYIQKRYPDTHTVTIYNPFDVQRLAEEAQAEIQEEEKAFFDENIRMIAAMGREDVLKGYWHLIKAFSKMNRLDVRLCIIGNGDFLREKQLVKDLSLEDRVYFTGGKKNPFAYLKYAHMYVMSSIHEGFPNALVEAMALEIPVVSTNCETGPAEILADDFQTIQNSKKIERAEYGILIPAMTEQPNYNSDKLEAEELLLAEAMEELLENTELYKRYKNKAKERANDFGTQKYVDAFRKLADCK